MEQKRASRTAEAAAATRAYYDQYRPPNIFPDPYARQFLKGFWRLVLATPLRSLVFELGLKPLKPVGGQVVARSRFAEDRLELALSHGIDQYVLVGAGYDSFSVRRQDLQHKLKVFEVDHPDTQQEKRRRLTSITRGAPPENLRFVPVDFERQSLRAGLAESDFDPTRPCFYAWLGTTAYLSNQATFDALSSMSALAAPGSELVFDFLGAQTDLLEPQHQALYQALKAFTAKRGEPIVGEMAVSTLTQRLPVCGWQLSELLGFDEQRALYFDERSDDAMPMPGSFLVHLIKPRQGAT
ncbi:MAG: SAM-dependent methyltransferase [Pseudomonadota bacterium]